jgi:hypothetical protein
MMPDTLAPVDRPRVNGSKPTIASLPAGDRYVTAARVAGRSFQGFAHLLVLVAAAVADVAAFYDVLANHTNLPDHLLYALVGGFTVVVLSLAHGIGASYRDKVDGAPDYRPLVLWSTAAAWLILGGVAFLARLVFSGPAPATDSTFGGTPSTVDANEGLVMAVLFIGLHLAGGIAAARGAFLLHNSIDRAVISASGRVRRLSTRLSRREQTHERLAAELRRLDRERERVELAHEAARLGRIALGDQLKQYVRIRIAQKLDDAAATDAMVEPDRYPFAASPLRATPAPRPGIEEDPS